MSGQPCLSLFKAGPTHKKAWITSWLYLSTAIAEKLLAAMQEPFPELIFLLPWSYGKEVVLPDSFLGGSAPRLQVLRLDGTPFPSLPKLLLTATHLVKLNLLNNPHSGYFSPKVMFTALSTLTSL
jgi:hypothetical protein